MRKSQESKIHLNSEWVLTFIHPETGEKHIIPAKVPGSIAADLMTAGILPDLYTGSNALAAKKWERTDFCYTTEFVAPETMDCEQLELCFDGIDTNAEIILNEETVETVCNMFIPHSFDISSKIKSGKSNTLEVHIYNVIDIAVKKVEAWGSEGLMTNIGLVNNGTSFESLYIRKARHMYGWDIAPRLLFGGLWRSVYLSKRKNVEILPDEFYFTVISCDVGKRKALVNISWGVKLDSSCSWEKYELTVTGICGNSSFSRSVPVRFCRGIIREVPIEGAEFWWPRGYGSANLYDLTLTLKYNGCVVDEYRSRVGVRSIDLDFNCIPGKPENNRFQFIVNGVPVFIRGSNWVPADAIHARDQERIPEILGMFTELNCNMIRIWGGGVYEDHHFFDYCDEHGIMVWQDFMFACARYPQNHEFLEQIKQEAEIIIRRLRNHASLALWAGDNEIDMFLFWGKGNAGKAIPSDNLISRITLREAVVHFDPQRTYLPSSPYISDEAYINGMNQYQVPEQHLWGEDRIFKDPFFSDNTALFASEIGCHGMSGRSCIEKFLSPEYLWGDPECVEWIVHASESSGRSDGEQVGRNRRMFSLVQKIFRESININDMDEFILASQVVQAEALKYFIEHFRSRKPGKTGIIWWNMIECWPQFSEAVVDYYFGKKLAYYYIKRVQTNICTIVMEPENGMHKVVIVNDTNSTVSGRVTLKNAESGEILLEKDSVAAANDKLELGIIPVCKKSELWLIETAIDGKNERLKNHYIAGEYPLDFSKYKEWLKILKISCSGGKNEIDQVKANDNLLVINKSSEQLFNRKIKKNKSRELLHEVSEN